MISLELAQRLKSAGLVWAPRLHDHFVIPDVGMDERSFVLTDILVGMEIVDGRPVFTFNGAVEWALDYVLQTEAVWLPTEAQLRQQLQTWLGATAALTLHWAWKEKGEELYSCTALVCGRVYNVQAAQADEAYARLLLACLTGEVAR